MACERTETPPDHQDSKDPWAWPVLATMAPEASTEHSTPALRLVQV